MKASRAGLLAMVLLALLTSRVRSQAPATAPAEPKFEVASIKPNREDSAGIGGANFVRNGRFTVTNAPFQWLIALAFGVDFRDQVLNLPEWTASAKYDINATTSVAVTTNVVGMTRVLLLALLKDRFHLEAHHETREVPTYELVVAKPDGRLGAGLHPSTADCNAPVPPGERRCGWSGAGPLHWGRAQPFALLIVSLSSSVDRRIVDKTGFSGPFDWQLQTQSDPNDNTAPSIFTAVQEQLGLKLQPARGTLDVIVVDHVEPPTPD